MTRLAVLFPVFLAGTLSAADFTPTSPLPEIFLGHALVHASGHLYHVGGMGEVEGVQDGNRVLRGALADSGHVVSWIEDTPLPEPVLFHSAVAWKDLVYVIGGYHFQGGIVISNKVYYSRAGASGALGEWKEATALPESMFLQSAAVWNGRIYVTGGWTGANNLAASVYSAVIQDDGSLSDWTAMSSLPTGVYSHVAVENGALYVVGGSVDGGTRYTNEVYVSPINSNGALAGWTPAAPLPNAVVGHSASAVGGKVYVAGGWTGSGALSDFLVSQMHADGQLSEWVALPSLPGPLYQHAAAVANGRLYLSGGSDGVSGQTAVSFIKLYEPPLPQDPPAPDPEEPPAPDPEPPSAAAGFVDFDPDRLNLLSNGNYVTARIEFARVVGNAANVSFESLALSRINGESVNVKPETKCEGGGGKGKDKGPCAPQPWFAIEDENHNGIMEYTVKFDRQVLAALLHSGDNILDIAGAFTDGRPFTAGGNILAGERERIVRKEEGGAPRAWKTLKQAVKSVARDGDRIETEGRARVVIEIPAGAIDKEVTVSVISEPVLKEKEAAEQREVLEKTSLQAAGPAASFGPEGTSFKEPVVLELTYDESAVPAGAEGRLAVHYWNALAKAWEEMPSTVDAAAGKVRATTTHFSLYQVLLKPAPSALPPAAAPAPLPPAPAPSPAPVLAAAVAPSFSWSKAAPPAPAAAAVEAAPAPIARAARGERPAQAFTEEAPVAFFAALAPSAAPEAAAVEREAAAHAARGVWDLDLVAAGKTAARAEALGRGLRARAEAALAAGRERQAVELLEAALLWIPEDRAARKLLETLRVRLADRAAREELLRLERVARARAARGRLESGWRTIAPAVRRARPPAPASAFALVKSIERRLSPAKLAELRERQREKEAQETRLREELAQALRARRSAFLTEADRFILARRYPEALNRIEAVLDEDPGDAPALERKRMVSSLLAKDVRPEVRARSHQVYYRAVASYVRGEFSSSRVWLDKIFPEDPSFEPAWRLKLRLDAARGR